MDLVDDLVLTPFKEIVDKATTAVENAGDENPEMLKTSQTLLKEGQRALKRIEPLCQKHFEEYGSNFTDALKENDEIAQYRTELNDFLWEFDDYIEVDDFDAEQFTKLQKLSRKAAPRVYDIVMRMKLEPIAKEERAGQTSSSESAMSSPAKGRPAVLNGAPRGPPNDMLPPLQIVGRRIRSATPTGAPLPGPPPRRSLPVTPVDGEPAELSVPPMPPNANPWDIKTKPSAFHPTRTPSLPERRRPAVPTQADLALLPQIDVQAMQQEAQQEAQQNHRLSQASQDGSQRNYLASQPHDSQRRNSPSPYEPQQRFSQPPLSPTTSTSSQPLNESPTLGTALPAVPVHVRPRMLGFPPTAHRPLDHAIPEHAPLDANGNGNGHAAMPPPPYVDRHSGGHNHAGANLTRTHSTDSFRSSVHGATSSAGDNRASVFSANESSSIGSPVFSQGAGPGTPASQRDSGARNSGSTRDSGGVIVSRDAEGLIAVDGSIDGEIKRAPLMLPPRDTSITLSSSFYVLKGFCEGAKEVMRGELGVKKQKKPTFTGSQLMAKCTHCFYELDWKEIELDINQSGEANFAIDKVGFRLRFLQKSHLPTRRADEVMYGCVFCVQEGHTAHDGDATVFFSQRELCDHLARHPRPLPHVPGVTVVDEPEMPRGSATSYDLHLRAPPVSAEIDDKWEEIARLPNAVAKETVKKMYGMKLLHDRTPAFELAVGAKIVGVEFPDKYNGEWCMGYHNGRYASFPFDVARLEPPPPHELRMGGSSSARAVAKWKFVVKDKTKAEWLKFDRGDVITNISWIDPDHWCWSGTNTKGKWGIFPKSHLDLATLRENEESDKASTVSGAASVKPKSLLGRMTSSRKSDDKPEVPPLPPTKVAKPERKYTPLPTHYHLAM